MENKERKQDVIRSKETKRKMSEAKKGTVPWNKGLTKADYKNKRKS